MTNSRRENDGEVLAVRMNQKKAAKFLEEFTNLPLQPLRTRVLPGSPVWTPQLAEREWLRFNEKWEIFPHSGGLDWDPGFGRKHVFNRDPILIQRLVRKIWSGKVTGQRAGDLVAGWLRLRERRE